MEIYIASIRVEPTLQPRTDGLNPAQVQELESVADNWPPLAVVQDGDRYILVDGFHRLAAAQNLGLDTVPVTVLDMPADGDLHALAFALNAIHGRPLTLSDRRAFALRILRAHPELSDRAIGRRSGLTQPPIGKLREALEAREEIAPTDTRVGSDGQSYRVSASTPKRDAGDLPESESESLVGKLFTSDERRAQRRLAQYFDRLAVALGDQYDLAGWDTHADAAQACRNVFDAERVAELAQILGDTSSNVLAIAQALGYVASTGE